MKAIRKAHEVDFWVWKKEWSKRQAAVELDKFFHEINATFDILVPFGEPRYLYINNHCYILPDEIVVYDEGHIYKYFHDYINSETFIKRYSVEKQETPSKYVIRLKDIKEMYLYYCKDNDTYKFGPLQSFEDDLVCFATEQEAHNFVNKLFLACVALETVKIEGEE